MKQYTYDAFISYRHKELDMFVAENLHKQLEAFRLPRNIARKKKDGRTRIERVFRDKDELPLTSNLEDPIMLALKESDYLIVICSPRLRDSLWCQKEIETFIRLHGREKVMAVLIEGEPEQSFPEALLYKEEKIENPDGTFEVVKVPAEPLAADVRGKSKSAIKKAIRSEILRLMAPMFDLNYDDLRQRHRERRMKRILAASMAGCSVCLAFGTVSTVMALRIQKQKDQIEVQSQEIKDQNEEIKNQNDSLLLNQALNLSGESERQLSDGDRVGAIQTAVQALTTYEGIEMPYTPNAQLALTNSLYAYDNNSYIKPFLQLTTAGVIDFMTLSPERDILLTYDYTGCLTLWNVVTGENIAEIRLMAGTGYLEDYVAFVGNDKLVYRDDEGRLSIYSIEENSVVNTIDVDFVEEVCTDIDSRYLIVKDFDSINVFDASTFSLLYQYKPEQDYRLCNKLYINEDATILSFQESEEEGNMYIKFMELSDGNLLSSFPVGSYEVEQIQFDGDTAYVLMNKSTFEFDDFTIKLDAIQISSHNKLWETTIEDFFGSELYKPYAEGADKLMLLTGGEAFLISEKDGSEYTRLSLGGAVAGGAVYVNSDIYIVFTRSGELHYILVDKKMDYVIERQFQCHSQDVKDFLVSSDNYLILPYMDNHITVYNYSAGYDLEEYSENLPKVEDNYLQYQEAKDKAAELGLSKAALTSNVFYNADNTIIYVVYSDNTMEIYRASDLELLKEIKDLLDEPRWDIGEDQSGHIFIRGISYGYMLDSDYNLVGIIEGLRLVNKDENRMVISDGNDTQYTVPIYTLEELLAKAESFVLR